MNVSDGREERLVGLLEDAIREELRVAAGIDRVGLTDSQVDTLTAAVSARLLYAFSFDWEPDWVVEGGVHSWQAPDGYHARCGICLADSASFVDLAAAERWAREHQAGHHVYGSAR